jgi:hypothetical protein
LKEASSVQTAMTKIPGWLSFLKPRVTNDFSGEGITEEIKKERAYCRHCTNNLGKSAFVIILWLKKLI